MSEETTCAIESNGEGHRHGCKRVHARRILTQELHAAVSGLFSATTLVNHEGNVRDVEVGEALLLVYSVASEVLTHCDVPVRAVLVVEPDLHHLGDLLAVLQLATPH